MGGESIKKDTNTEPAAVKVYDKWLAFGGAVLILLMILSGYFVKPMQYSWLFIMILMIGFFILIGLCSGNGRLDKILIDNRKQMSLSRFQLVLWTLVILSAYLTIVLGRINTINLNDPSAGAALQSAMIIQMPWQLIALLGISLTAVAGTSLILGAKKDITLTSAREQEIKKNLDKKIRENEGTVCENQKIENANFTDMFKGDEVGDCATINMAKVQMFFFTVVIIVAYSLLILNSMIIKTPAFPDFSQELVTILGLSTAGYLTEKAVPSTRTNEKPEVTPEVTPGEKLEEIPVEILEEILAEKLAEKHKKEK